MDDASSKVAKYIDGFEDWRSNRLKELRELINQASSELSEEFKWNVPVWTHNGLICAISAFKDHVKINFFKGACLSDPKGLFNSGLDSKEHRSINMSETDKIDKAAIKQLIAKAIAYNKGKL